MLPLVERLACADIRNRLPGVGDHFPICRAASRSCPGRAAVRNAHCRDQRPLICATDKLIPKPNDLRNGAITSGDHKVVDQVYLAPGDETVDYAVTARMNCGGKVIDRFGAEDSCHEVAPFRMDWVIFGQKERGIFVVVEALGLFVQLPLASVMCRPKDMGIGIRKSTAFA
ncbi:MAG: hypothetical protein IPN48_12090 [Sphingomonadales bacterium]|nr:hypothetical protein [Sphingomonadales bacterium]